MPPQPSRSSRQFGLIRRASLICPLILFLTNCQLSNGRPQMTIPVTLNDQYKLLLSSNLGPLVLDTGAAVSLVDAAFAKRHKLKRSGETATVRDVSGAEADVEMAVIPKVSIPAREPGQAWEIDNVLVVVIPRMQNREHIGAPFILGMPALEDRIVELDLPKSQIRLLRHLPIGLNCKSVRLKVADSGGGGTPGIPVQIHGSPPMHGVLDTGYGEYFSFNSDAWPTIPIKDGSRRKGTGGGFLADMTFEKARAARPITVGNVTVANSPMSQSHGSEWRHTLIGVSVWKHTTVAIDWDSRKAVFRTPSPILNHLRLTISDSKKAP
jgi:hypothetical protein